MKLRPIQRTNKSVSYNLPAPLKGLNKRDSLADMDAGYAIEMDNYLPQDTKVALRNGYVKYVATEHSVPTLAVYNHGADSKMLAVCGHKFLNVSSAKNVYNISDMTFSEDYCCWAQYKNRLYFVNGIDIPKVYYIDDNGEEHLENWGFFGNNLPAASMVNVSVSKQRLWFVEKGSLKVWYPQTAGNISGELKCFDFAQVSRFGGYLVAVANWTQDGGQGIDDLTVFITSEGEVLVYSGSDISNSNDWKLRGSYKISRPIGYKATVSYQGDVVIITEDGYLPLSSALPLDKANSSQIAFSDAIRGLVLERTAKYAHKKGWQGLIYGRGGYAVFNVPLQKNYEQHVINLNTGAWCRFSGINALCWCEFEQRAYFGAENGIYLFDEGNSDNGNPINGVVEQAYNDFGTNLLKKIQLLNPRTKSSSDYALVIYTNMDMEKRSSDSEEYIETYHNTRWNKVKWSTTVSPTNLKWFSNNTSVRGQWIANSSTGYKASIVFKTKTVGITIEWYETGIRYEVGTGVL